jgi:uncharacterized membrane protein YfcA
MLDMISLLFISVLVGFIGSLTGLGGASILTPILVFFGIPIKEAIASGMAAIIATSSGAASSFVRDRLSNIKIAMFLEMFTSSGAIIGATITVIIAPVFLYFFFAAFLLLSFVKPRSSKDGSQASPLKQDKLSKSLELKGCYYDEARNEKVDYCADNCLLGGAGMFVAGLAAGMLGIGAGAFKVTVQENVLKMPPKVSSSTSSFIIGMTALAGISAYFFSGLLNLSLMTPMAVGTTIGAMIGGRTLNKFTDKRLKALFFIIVVFIVIQMLYKGITSL